MKDWQKKTTLFLTSQAVTLFGSSVVQFALIWYVTRETSSGFWVAMTTVCAYVPQFIISFFAGVWADRYARKALIIGADAGIAVATLALALIFHRLPQGTPRLIALLIASAIRSVGAGIQTPAVSAMLPQLVPEEKLIRINGINATIQSVVQFAAPAAAGAVLTFASLTEALYIDIATAVVGIGLFATVAVPQTPKGADGVSVLTDMKIGVSYAFRDPLLGKLLPLFGLFIFLCVPAGFLATLFVTRTFGDTYLYMTLVELVGFAGMALGGVLISAWGGFKRRETTFFVGMLAFGALGVGMGVARAFAVYLVLMLIYGIALTMVQTATTTLIQENAAPAMQGRVFGLLGAMFSGFLPLGMAIFGPLADVVPIRAVMIGSGVAILLEAVLGARRLTAPPRP